MAKKIILSEEQLELCKPVQEDENVFNNMGLLDDDELMEYARLRQENTGIDLDIFIDDGGAYKRYGHPLWVYVRNGYTKNDPFFHIEVSKTPIAPNIPYNISKIDLMAVLSFIEVNYELLNAIANDKISHLEFYNACRPVIYAYASTEKKYVKEQALTRKFSSMTISQNPKVIKLPKKRDLSTKDIRKIADFVKANESLLLGVSRNEITYQYFLQNMIKV